MSSSQRRHVSGSRTYDPTVSIAMDDPLIASGSDSEHGRLPLPPGLYTEEYQPERASSVRSVLPLQIVHPLKSDKEWPSSASGSSSIDLTRELDTFINDNDKDVQDHSNLPRFWHGRFLGTSSLLRSTKFQLLVSLLLVWLLFHVAYFSLARTTQPSSGSNSLVELATGKVSVPMQTQYGNYTSRHLTEEQCLLTFPGLFQ